VTHACNPSYSGSRDQEAHGSAVRAAQVVEYLPRKPKALSSSPGTTKKGKKGVLLSQVPVDHTPNPSYSGGRDQEDRSLKPTWANSL
jgi:hypothetical protein